MIVIIFFTFGIIFFSGSLYLLACSELFGLGLAAIDRAGLHRLAAYCLLQAG